MTAQFEELHVLRSAVFLQSLLLKRGAGAFVTVVSTPYDSFQRATIGCSPCWLLRALFGSNLRRHSAGASVCLPFWKVLLV